MNLGKRKNMVQNKKRRKWGAVCLGLCLLTACQQEIGIDPDPEGGMFLMYNSDVKPLAGTTDKVRAIVFAASSPSGSKTFVSNTEFTGTSGKIPLQGGKYQDIYMIINEEEDLAGIKTLEQLQNVKINENLSTDVNAIRQRYHYSHNIYARTDGSVLDGDGVPLTELSSSQYTAAKVRVEFDLTPVTGDVSLKFTGAKLIEVPAYSYLIPRTYDGTGYGERNFNLPAHDVPGAPYKHTVEVAVPEYLPPAGGQVMMLIISADRYRNGSKEGSSEYQFQVGNYSMTGAGTDNNVDRNKVYKFKFTGITGPGVAVDDWKVGKQVVDSWTEEQVDTEVDGAYGFFLQTELLDNFRAFRMPRYVNFRAEGPGKVWVDVPRFSGGEAMVPNQFSCKVLWNDNSEKSGRLELKLGNWQVGKDFDVYIRMVANNIERTLIVKCKSTVFSKQYFTGTWGEGMGYQSAMLGVLGRELGKRDVMIKYWSQDGPRKGCAGYYDPDNADNDPVTGKGCWRMATIRENIIYARDVQYVSKTNFWAYEALEHDENASYYTYCKIKPPSDVDLGQDLDKNYYGTRKRDEVCAFLCVQDDKLDIYYNIEVSPADYEINVSYDFAQKVCDDIPNDGKGKWRLPSPQEADYALKNAGTQGIPNNFNAGLYWLNTGEAAGPANPTPSQSPTGNANVRCVRARW